MSPPVPPESELHSRTASPASTPRRSALHRSTIRDAFPAALVPIALVLVALGGYAVLVLGGRTLPVAGFAVLTSFYLLANTVGRGVFAALELELTRTVAAAAGDRDATVRACRAVLVRGAGVLAATWVVLAGTAPLLARALGGGDRTVLLGAAAATLALSAFVRGPLAGAGRYRPFATTLAVEAAVCVLGAATLVGLGVTSTDAWLGLLVVAPGAGALAALVGGVRPGAVCAVLGAVRHTDRSGRRSTRADPAPGATSTGRLVAGSVLYLGSQGVWNLGPVIVAARSAGAPGAAVAAAAFAAAVVLLRAPVMAFPAVQALLLPRLVRGDAPVGRSRRGAVALAGGALAALWIAGAVVVAPAVVRLLFGIAAAPPAPVLLLLALSVVGGTAAQFAQTRLLAAGRVPVVAATWCLALGLLVAGALGPGDAVLAAAAAQAVATVVALGVLVLAHRRTRS